MKRRMLLPLIGASILGAGAFAGYRFLRSPRFGAEPVVNHRIASSPHFWDGAFHNSVETPVLSDGSSMPEAFLRSLITKTQDPRPTKPLISVKSQVSKLPDNTIVWLGHSSFYLQLSGLKILIDPVFSPYASPLSISNQAFEGCTPYQANDFPTIDCVLISHDHWDHLDYPTIMALKNKTQHFLCPLGVEAHLLRWGIPEQRIRSLDWDEKFEISTDYRIRAIEARHYAGRSLHQNNTLWCGYFIETPQKRVFFSGDSGYGPHFKTLATKLGAIDLALLDCGQYNSRWQYIHMHPSQAYAAFKELGAAAFLPAHVGKFSLAPHPWYEPFELLTQYDWSERAFLTPVIGAPLSLTRADKTPFWWKTFI